MSDDDDFYIILPSNTAPNNTVNHFTTNLNKHIDLVTKNGVLD